MISALSVFHQTVARIRAVFQSGDLDRDLDAEIESHIRLRAGDYINRGVVAEEAERLARIEMGGIAQLREAHRRTRGLPFIETFFQDLRYAFRGMRRNAAFTAFAILITGLGIGASSTVFSVVNALLLRPLPFRDPGRLVWIANQEWSTQVEHFQDLREQNRSFADLAGWFGGYGAGDWQFTGTGEPQRMTGVPVTQNFFSLLGVEPVLGRSFTVEECRGNYYNPPAVVLSHGFWERGFASDPSIVGRKLTINNGPATVVGVLPVSFDFAAQFAPGAPVDIFVPWPLADKVKPAGNTMAIIGRLKTGASVQHARAEFAVLAKHLNSLHPERNPIHPLLDPLRQRISRRLQPALLVLACAVGVVMLIVCANLSNLQLARLAPRQKEMALRVALGAGRLRLLRQMFTESVALSCCGAVLGLALSVAGVRAVAHLTAFNLPLLTSVRIDGAALAFTLIAAVLTGVLFGLLPAVQTSAVNLQDTLKQAGGRALSAAKGPVWLRNGLVVSEIAFTSVLLIGAGLLVRSFVRVLDVDLGFQPEHTAFLRVDPSFLISTLPQQDAFLDDVQQRARSVPGVRAAGLIDILPFAGDRSFQVSARGHVYPKDRHPEAFIRVVSEGYFAAAGIRLRAGRFFATLDRASTEPVVIINQTLARTLWPGQDPIGQVVTQDGGRRVVGVVDDVRHGALEERSGSEMYLPMRQTLDYPAMELVVRTALPPETLAAGLREALRPLDPNLPIHELQSLQNLVDKAVSPRRFLVMLLGGFAGFALLLASLGIYAVISYSVSQRVQEIGIRMALGASPGELQRRILLGTFGLTAIGLALGMVASRALSKLLSGLLFGVSSGDPVTYFGVGALLIVVAAAAGYLPAWRASRIAPMAALRSN